MGTRMSSAVSVTEGLSNSSGKIQITWLWEDWSSSILTVLFQQGSSSGAAKKQRRLNLKMNIPSGSYRNQPLICFQTGSACRTLIGIISWSGLVSDKKPSVQGTTLPVMTETKKSRSKDQKTFQESVLLASPLRSPLSADSCRICAL
jgi:hypothetical protein